MTATPKKGSSSTSVRVSRSAVTGRYVTKANHKRAAQIYSKAVESQGQKAPSWIKRISG